MQFIAVTSGGLHDGVRLGVLDTRQCLELSQTFLNFRNALRRP
jgi:hypothetical protein